MGFVHGKGSSIKVATFDMSAYTNNVAFNQKADSHDTTTFGKNSHTYIGGLKDGTITLTGIYDSGTGGPKAKLQPLLATTVVCVWAPEGAVTGKPLVTVSAVLTAYEETAPVADIIAWSVTGQLSDDAVYSTSP